MLIFVDAAAAFGSGNAEIVAARWCHEGYEPVGVHQGQAQPTIVGDSLLLRRTKIDRHAGAIGAGGRAREKSSVSWYQLGSSLVGVPIVSAASDKSAGKCVGVAPDKPAVKSNIIEWGGVADIEDYRLPPPVTARL